MGVGIMDIEAVCNEYGPSKACAVNRHNDHCRFVMATWIKSHGYVIGKQPDGSFLLSVRCLNIVGEPTLARAYEGTEEECEQAANSLMRLV